MVSSAGSWLHPRWDCVPLPLVLARLGVLVAVLVFVVVLLRLGYDPRTCLVLVSGAGLVASQLGRQVTASGRAAVTGL